LKIMGFLGLAHQGNVTCLCRAIYLEFNQTF
jgi:hypothetical protein